MRHRRKSLGLPASGWLAFGSLPPRYPLATPLLAPCYRELIFKPLSLDRLTSSTSVATRQSRSKLHFALAAPSVQDKSALRSRPSGSAAGALVLLEKEGVHLIHGQSATGYDTLLHLGEVGLAIGRSAVSF